MKKLVALLTALIMMMGAVAALAVPEGSVPITDETGKVWGYRYYDKKTNQTTTGWYDANGSLDSYSIDYENADHEKAWADYKADGRYLGSEYWDGHNYVYFGPNNELYDAYISGDHGNYHYVSSTGTWYDDDNNIVDNIDVSKYLDKIAELLKGKKIPKKNTSTWYSHNTQGVVGISLRDQYPNLTSKWYNVLPVDLSRDGTQTFPMVAANMFLLGNVTVTVAGDLVTTTYSTPTGANICVYPEDECLAWFTGVEEISHDYLENPTPMYMFGRAISKENDLNGQDYALLFVCNHVTYRIPLNDRGANLTRFWKNHPKYATLFANARTLFTQVEAEYAAKSAGVERPAAVAPNANSMVLYTTVQP